MDLPNNTPDPFDKDITTPTPPIGSNHPSFLGGDTAPTLEKGDFLMMAFAELYESFEAMVAVGFTADQALKFLAYVSAINGDY